MLKYFSTTKSIIVNIAQIVLIVFIIPILFGFCFVVNPNSTSTLKDILLEFINHMPLIEVAFDILAKYVSMSSENVSEIALTVLLKAFPETILVSVVVHICNTAFQLMWRAANLKIVDSSLFVKPLNIFPTFVGIVVSTFIIKALEQFGDITAIIGELIVSVIVIIGIKIMFKSFFGGKIFSFLKIFTIVVDGLFAVIVICYVAAMVLFAQNAANISLIQFFRLMSDTLATTALAAVITFVVSSFTSKFD